MKEIDIKNHKYFDDIMKDRDIFDSENILLDKKIFEPMTFHTKPL